MGNTLKVTDVLMSVCMISMKFLSGAWQRINGSTSSPSHVFLKGISGKRYKMPDKEGNCEI